jgi:hypothetical protein
VTKIFLWQKSFCDKKIVVTKNLCYKNGDSDGVVVGVGIGVGDGVGDGVSDGVGDGVGNGVDLGSGGGGGGGGGGGSSGGQPIIPCRAVVVSMELAIQTVGWLKWGSIPRCQHPD